MWPPLSQLQMPHLGASTLISPIRHPHMGPQIVTWRTYYEPNFTIECPLVALSTNLRCQLGPAPPFTKPILFDAQGFMFKQMASRVNVTPLPSMIIHANAQA